ncbi:MAG: HAD family hydrolase, partial [Anaerolineae bacterium]|nr:HAD family hydrolase [Anaerolineae bacterium]
MERDPVHPRILWAGLTHSDVLARLHVAAAQGLTLSECETRRSRYGPNLITPETVPGLWELCRRQLADWPGLVLVGVVLVAGFSGELKFAALLLAFLGLGVLADVVQERRAPRALAVLRKLAHLHARVRREGREQVVRAADLVPGDIVFLVAGDLVPADGRLLEASDLRVEEALLTGEPEPAEKITVPIGGFDLAAADQRNMVFMGTRIAAGRGIMVVTETGMHTQLGRALAIRRDARLSPAPPIRYVQRYGRILALVSLALAALIIGSGVLQGVDMEVSLRAAISLIVAVFPVGWPIIALIAAAAAARQLLHRRALMRRLAAVATLGSTTVACVEDAALIEDHLTVAAQDVIGRRLTVTVTHHRHRLVLSPDEMDGLAGDESPFLLFLLLVAGLCNDATWRPVAGRPGHWRAFGERLEAALLAAAARAGLWKSALEAALPCVERLPGHERITTAHRVVRSGDRLRPGPTPLDSYLPGCLPLEPVFWIVFSRGSVDSVLALAQQVWVDGRSEPLDAPWRERILAAADEMAARGMYPMGMAFRIIEPDLWRDDTDVLPVTGRQLEQNLIFAGLIGVLAPPKPGVPEALAACRAAGIRPLVWTAARPQAARAAARAFGLDAGDVLSGPEIGQLKPEKLRAALANVVIGAQMTAEHRLALVQALQERGDVVAVIGDEIADLPALCRADIGAARGTSAGIVQDAADLVLLDDCPAMLSAAAIEGRAAQQALRRFVRFALAGNIGKALLILLMPWLGLPFPFSPLQVLYLNLAIDGLLGSGMVLGNGADPPAP